MADDRNVVLPDRPKEALQAYIDELEREYYPWYRRASRNNFYLWLIAQIVAVFAGFATAIVAALIDHQRTLLGRRATPTTRQRTKS